MWTGVMITDNEERAITISQTNLAYLKRHFVWPRDDEGDMWFYLKLLIMFGLTSNLWVGCLIHIAHVKQENLDVDLHEDIAGATALLSQAFCVLCFIYKRQTFTETMTELSNFGDFGRPEEFDKANKDNATLSSFCYYFSIAGVLIYGSVPIVEIHKCRAYNVKHNVSEICGLFAPVYVTFDIDYTPVRQILYVVQILSAVVCMMPPMMVMLLCFELETHMLVRIKHLKNHSRLLKDSDDLKMEIGRFVRHHHYVSRLMARMNQCTPMPLLTHFVLTSTVLALIMHQILNLSWKTPAGPVMHLLCWTVSLFANCYGGQRIIDESETIGREIYETVEWYDMELDIQKDLWFIMVRSQKPLLVLTGPVGHMSVALFLMVMKGLYYLVTFPAYKI